MATAYNYYVVKSATGNIVELRKGKKLFAHTAKLTFKVCSIQAKPEYAHHPNYGRYVVRYHDEIVERNKSISQTTYRGAKAVAKVSYGLFTKRWREVTGSPLPGGHLPWAVKVSKKLFDILVQGAR